MKSIKLLSECDWKIIYTCIVLLYVVCVFFIWKVGFINDDLLATLIVVTIPIIGLMKVRLAFSFK